MWWSRSEFGWVTGRTYILPAEAIHLASPLGDRSGITLVVVSTPIRYAESGPLDPISSGRPVVASCPVTSLETQARCCLEYSLKHSTLSRSLGFIQSMLWAQPRSPVGRRTSRVCSSGDGAEGTIGQPRSRKNLGPKGLPISRRRYAERTPNPRPGSRVSSQHCRSVPLSKLLQQSELEVLLLG